MDCFIVALANGGDREGNDVAISPVDDIPAGRGKGVAGSKGRL
jgi:hypothetical protein